MKKLVSNGIKICLSIAAIALVAISCQKNISGIPAGNTGLNIFLTDDQSLIFDAVFIDIVKLEIKTEDDSNSESGNDDNGSDDSGHHNGGDDNSANHQSGGWITLDIHAGIYNLLNFRNGLDTILGNGFFPSAHTLKKVRLTLGNNSSVELNGNSFPLTVKDNNNEVVINLEDAFMNVSGSGNLNFWLDFDAGRSIRFKDNQFELKSSIKAFSKNKAGSIEGRVLPAASRPVIYAVNGTDTSSARPEREGEFKFIGLKPGSYTLFIKPTAGNYKDTTISGIVVTKGEDAHTGVIKLHQ